MVKPVGAQGDSGSIETGTIAVNGEKTFTMKNGTYALYHDYSTVYQFLMLIGKVEDGVKTDIFKSSYYDTATYSNGTLTLNNTYNSVGNYVVTILN